MKKYVFNIALVCCIGLIAFKTPASPEFLLTFLLLFIASHAVGRGAVIWIFISEIFPNKIRARGQSFGASTHWVFAAISTLITPYFPDKEHGVLKNNPWPIFAFLAFMMTLQLIWVLTKVPETKKISLEQLEKNYWKIKKRTI